MKVNSLARRTIRGAQFAVPLLVCGLALGWFALGGRARAAESANPFGHWDTDAAGLPVFIYTMDEFNDPRALYPTSNGMSNDHWHLLGNGHIVALAYNHGEVVIYSGERGSTWLNERDPSRHRFAGGYGFLQDGNTLISMRYPDRPAGCSYKRDFGIGYFRRELDCPDIRIGEITQVSVQDTYLVSLLAIENKTDRPKKITWYEYWDVNPFYFGMMPEVAGEGGEAEGEGKGLGQLTPLLTRSLRFLPDNFFLSRLVAGGLHSWRASATKDFLISTERLEFGGCGNQCGGDALIASVRAPSPPVSREARSAVDYYPPTFFLTPVGTSEQFERFETNRSVAFDGQGHFTGRLSNGLVQNTPLKKAQVCLIGSLSREIPPQKGDVLIFLVGYTRSGNVSEAINHATESWMVRSFGLAQWRDVSPLVTLDPPWLADEMQWHAYYLRAMATYDDYFKSRIISQGCSYQYMMGMNIAARDPLQHMLPVVYLEPGLAKDVLRYTLEMMNEKGFIPYGIKGVGMRTAGGNPFPSDTNLYLLLALTEYVTATRDFAFLQEDLPYYPREDGRHGTVLDHLRRAYRHQMEDVGIGAHGLIKLRNSDWSDTFIAEVKAQDKKLDLAQVEREAESVLNTAMATYIFPRFSDLVRKTGDEAWAKTIEAQAASFRRAVAAQWNCRWYNRAILPGDRVVGVDTLFVEPQPWAILGHVPEVATEAALDDTMFARLTSASPIGAVQRWPSSPPGGGVAEKPGMGTNGGVWYSLRMPLIMAYARLRPDYAWQEFVKMSLHAHAEAYPDTWIGQWSGPDAYNGPSAERPGQAVDLLPFSGAMSDFPIMCGHAHAVPWFALIKLMGIQPDADGFTIYPRLPEGEFTLKTELLELERRQFSMTGVLKPLNDGTVVWRVQSPRPTRVTVEGKPAAAEESRGLTVFTTEARAGRRSTWSVEWR